MIYPLTGSTLDGVPSYSTFFSLHGDADQTWIALRTSTDLQQAGPLLKKEKHIYGELDR